MEEIQNGNGHKTSHPSPANGKKRKGFWANLFGRGSNGAKADEKKEDHKGGLMDNFMHSARQAAVREVGKIVKDEAEKKTEAFVKDNINGSQSTGTTANTAPGTTNTTSPSDAVNASTNWAKRMASTARERVQGLQNPLNA